MSPTLRLRSCSSAQANSRRTSSRMPRNDVPSSASRRLNVRPLTVRARGHHRRRQRGPAKVFDHQPSHASAERSRLLQITLGERLLEPPTDD